MPTDIEQQIADLTLINQALEEMAAEIDELKNERDYWENEYNEVISCLGGQDPRRSETERS